MVALLNKRQILQSILDKQEDLWIIMKPSRNDPTDPDELCVFQSPGQWKEARTEIPISWFLDRELGKIETAVRDALERAEAGYKYS